jgi:type VI protein secretion system component VasK
MKWATTFFLLLGIGLLLVWPLAIGERPEADRAEMTRYGMRLLIYFGATTLAFLGAAICATVLARQTRQRFVDEAKRNLRDLVEGASRDHERS